MGVSGGERRRGRGVKRDGKCVIVILMKLNSDGEGGETKKTLCTLQSVH